MFIITYIITNTNTCEERKCVLTHCSDFDSKIPVMCSVIFEKIPQDIRAEVKLKVKETYDEGWELDIYSIQVYEAKKIKGLIIG